MSKLIIEDEHGNIKVVPLTSEPITIGRKEDNIIHLPDLNVSRYHAKIFKENEKLFIEDVQSRYGIKINGHKIGKKSVLTPNDLVTIGDYSIRFVEMDDAAVDSDRHIRKTIPRIIPDIVRMESEAAARTKPMDAFEGIDYEETEREKRPSPFRKPLFLGISASVVAIAVGALFYFTGAGSKEESNIVIPPAVEEKPQIKREFVTEEKPSVVKEDVKEKEPVVQEVKKEKFSEKEEKRAVKETVVVKEEKKSEKKEKDKQVEEKKEKVKIAAIEKGMAEKEKTEKKHETTQAHKKSRVDEIYREGRNARLEGKIDLAIKLFKQCLALNPSHAEAARQLGNIYGQTGNSSEAIKYWKKYLQIRPNASDAEAVRDAIKRLGGTP